MIGQTVSYYRILQQLAGVVWRIRPKISTPDATLHSSSCPCLAAVTE
jgi:hypothetical protein